MGIVAVELDSPGHSALAAKTTSRCKTSNPAESMAQGQSGPGEIADFPGWDAIFTKIQEGKKNPEGQATLEDAS